MLVCFFWIVLLYPQSQITFRQLSVKEGLSQNSVVSVTQDSTGYLWIATQDGLNKYDGRNFNILPYSFVDITKPDYSNLGKVYTDRKGEVWIIPQNKIPHKYNKETREFEPLSIIDDASVIFQDSAFNIWFGTYSSGFYMLPYHTNEPHQVLKPDAIQGTVYNIAQDPIGNLHLAKDDEIAIYDMATGKLLKISPKTIYGEPIAANFSDIVFDEHGTEWISTFGKGLYFREREETAYQRIDHRGFSDPLPADLNITDLHFDKKNRLWIATYGRGLYMVDFKLQKISHFKVAENNPKTLHYDDVLCIYEDYSGTLWFGTDGAGISYYDEYLEKFNSLTNYQTPENINIDVVRAIVVDQEQAVWIGTSGKGLTRYEPATNSWQAFKAAERTDNTIQSDRIMSLLVDTENNLWIGSQGNGLSVFDDQERFTHFSPRTKTPLSAETIWDIFRDAQDRFWLASREQGLILFDKDKGELKKYKTQKEPGKGPPGNNIRVIASGKNGKLWLGTEEEGIASFDPTTETFTWYRHSASSNSIASNNIKSLYEDPNGILWIGTNAAGLTAFDTKNSTFRSYTVEDGLANNVIYGILPDEEGNLWLSSNKGITKFTPGKTLDDTPSIVNYANYDGLATEFNTGAYYKDSSGNLYFGGLDGFYWFRPKNLKENSVLPKTAITDLQVFNESRSLTKTLDLKHTENTVTFTFSSMQYSLPEKNQYQYRLLNYEKDWVEAGNTNFARYSQLPPGSYEFQVKSSNYDGVWNEHAESYEFTIRSPWYLTSLAKVVYFLLFLAGLYAIYSYLKWRLRMRLKLQLQEAEAARLQRLNDFKTKLYTDVSHEFRTPLTLISGPVDAKLSEGSLSETDFTNFSMIKRNTNRLIALVDQLLQLAKLEKGKQKLKISEGNLGLFLQMLASAFDYRAAQKNIMYTVKVNDMGNAWYDEDTLEKIVTNLLSNAFKHGLEGGDCQLEASCENKYLHLSVKNTVAPESGLEVEKLFSRFYQQDEYSEGAGIGLSLTKELVHLHQGEISVRIEKGNCIHFLVRLPIQQEVFPDLGHIQIITEPDHLDATFTSNKMVISPVVTEHTDKGELPILLLVEDHKEVREFIKSVWKNKFRLVEANNGRSGIEKALETVPDLIITDVRMPVCDGIELCNTLKTDERTSHVPIILLTAGVGEEQELRGLRSGADDFITKPFKLPILQAKVENLIASRKTLRNRYSQEIVLKAKDIAVTPTDTLFFERVQKVLDEQLSNPDFSVESFCKSVGMSRMQLHRKLMAFTGLSTSAFIRSQRLKQAVYILKTSDATINEVAYTVGFNTPSYFIKCFKETYKKTPMEYLKSLD